jgi:methionyl-tRNA synthetase
LTKKIVREKLEIFKLHEALIAINELISFGDKYVNDNEIWKETESKKDILLGLVVILDNVSALLAPFLPQTAETIQKSIIWTDHKTLIVEKSGALFPRLN